MQYNTYNSTHMELYITATYTIKEIRCSTLSCTKNKNTLETLIKLPE